MPLKLRLYLDSMAALSVGSGITAWQEQLDWGLRIVAALVAITAGGLSIWRYFRQGKVPDAG